MNSRWTAGISTVRYQSSQDSSSVVFWKDIYLAEIIESPFNLSRRFSGRLQKERASAKAAPSRPVHKELQTFHCCKAVSHGPFLCGLIIRSPGSTGTSPGSPCYTFHCTRWGGFYKNRRDWRLRLTKSTYFFKYLLSCVIHQIINHIMLNRWSQCDGRCVDDGYHSTPLRGERPGGGTQNSFWRCPQKKTLRVKRDAYIVISLLWLIPEFLAEAFRICTKETEMIHSHRLYNHHVRDQHWAALIFSDPSSWRFRLHCSRWSSDEWRPWWRLPAFFGLGLLIQIEW